MAQRLSQPESVNVLLSDANWAWPQAVTTIFQPRNINALVADCSRDMVHLVASNRIHLAILDAALDDLSGLRTLKIIRKHDEHVPSILLAHGVDEDFLAEALRLGVFSVLDKPVDLSLLAGMIDRLFVKNYASNMFSSDSEGGPQNRAWARPQKRAGVVSTVIKWTVRKRKEQ